MRIRSLRLLAITWLLSLLCVPGGIWAGSEFDVSPGSMQAGAFRARLVWVPDGEHFLISYSGSIWRFDKSGQYPAELVLEIPELSDNMVLAINSTGTLLAAGAFSYSEVMLWDYPSLELVGRIAVDSKYVSSLQFSPDDSLLAIAGSNRSPDGFSFTDFRIEVWNVVQMSQEVILQDGFIPVKPNMAFLDGNRQLFVTGSSFQADYDIYYVQLWDLETLTQSEPLPQRRTIMTAPIIQGDFLVVPLLTDHQNFGLIQVWELQTELVVHEFADPSGFVSNPHAFVKTLAMSHDETLLATGNGVGQLRVWNVETETELVEFERQADYFDQLAFSPDGSLLVSTSLDGTVRVWDIGALEEVAVLTLSDGM